MLSKARAEGEDLFAPNVLIVSAGVRGNKRSLCCWTKPLICLLPKTDFIAFNEADGATCSSIMYGWAPWERVAFVVGHRMRPMGLDPERFRVESFPSEDELVALQLNKTRNFDTE